MVTADKGRRARRKPRAADTVARTVPAHAVADTGGFVPAPAEWGHVGRATENLQDVRALWSPLYAWNYASQVGGDPLRRMALIYGLSRHGKSLRLYTRYRTHLDAGGVVYHVPAERGEDPDFLRAILGPHYDSPRFIVPDSSTVFSFSWLSNEAATFAGYCAEQTRVAKEHGHDWIGGLFGVDSAVAISPDEIVDDLMRDARYEDYASNGGKKEFGDPTSSFKLTKRFNDNNHWMRLAQQLGGWFWPINQRFFACNVTGVWLTQCAQKGEKVVGTGLNKRREPIWEPKLGRGLYEPHGLMEFIAVDDALFDDGGDVPAIRHWTHLQKNKCGAIPEGRERVVPFFFRKDRVELDHARNLLYGCLYAEELTGEPVVQVAGSYYKFDGQVIGQGVARTLRALRADAGLFGAVAGALQDHEQRTREQRRGVVGLAPVDDESVEVSS